MHETAYAKINLALHIRRRRDDGYHELETLFAFVDNGDLLEVLPGARDSLILSGEFATQLTQSQDNIVLHALASLPHKQPWTVLLDKRLPVAAGLGGGSADAGAIFRLVEAAQGLPPGWKARAAMLGADVPACVRSEACLGYGTGTELTPLDSDLAGMPVLLVNPRVPLSTGPVFRAWDGVDRGPLPQGTARKIALEGRNDLEFPAMALCPAIAFVLAALGQTKPLLARMSGSGATCFALYEHHDAMRKALDYMDSVAFRLVDDGGSAAVNPEPFRIIGTPRFGGILIVADHAANRVPGDIDLDIDPALLHQHIAWDIGVAGVAERMAQRPGTAAFLGNVSRLVCDFNREEGAPAIIPIASDGHAIPGNSLSHEQHEARLDRFYRPYHAALAALLDDKPPALILSLHSFTPSLASHPDEQRPWQVGILYNQDDRAARLAIPLLEAEGLVVGDQQPYSGKLLNASMNRHAEAEGRPYLGVEIRQDGILDEAGQAVWAERIGRICNVVALAIT